MYTLCNHCYINKSMYSLNNSGAKLIVYLRCHNEFNTLTVSLDWYADICYFTILSGYMFDIHSNIIHKIFLKEMLNYSWITSIGIKFDEES